jgi:hypothetical protein
VSEAVRDAEDEDSPDPVLEALWARVLDAWGDEKPHAAVLEHAVRAGRLPEIAGRYRQLAQDPEKAPTANKQLDAIVQSATAALFSMKMPRPQGTPLPITLSAFGVCLFLLAWLAYAVWGKH